MFVEREPIAVTVDDLNFIYIKPKFGFGDKQKLLSLASHITADTTGMTDTIIDIGGWNVALLTLGIVRWEGPAFAGVPCNAATIARLDPDEPLVVRTLADLATRNQTASVASADPNASTSAGGPN